MSAKITITGEVKNIRKIPDPNNKNPKNPIYWNLLEMKEAGSPNSPKNLPRAEPISYTVIMNDKQYNKLLNTAKEYGFGIKGERILIQGEITLDLPMSIINEIGVITFQAQHLTVQKLLTEKQKEENELE